MEINQAIKQRFSCRSFSTKEIPLSCINEILNAARLAPSPKNRQPWRFTVLQQERKQELEKIISRPLNSDMYTNPSSKKLKEWNSWQNTYKVIQEANTIILVFNIYPSNLVLGAPDTLFDITNIQSIGAAIQNMLLKATDLGVGSLWICDIFSHYRDICNRYCPDGQLIAAVALGYPQETTSNCTRRPLNELIIKEN
jgi:nitroreductase